MKKPVSKTDGPQPDGMGEADATAGEPSEDSTAARGPDDLEELDDLGEVLEIGTEGAPAEKVGEDLSAELLGLREEFADLNDRHLRLAAEFNNYRRRVEAERTEVWARAQAEAVGRLVGVLDDLQRVAALDLSNATVENILEGIDLVDRKFSRILGELGVEVLDPVGEPFDPAKMEAMMRVPASSDEEEDRVAQVFDKGYALKGTLIRPARVSVYKHG